MSAYSNGQWNAAAFFEMLTVTNKLAQNEGFVFCRVSGLEGFEEAVNQAQNQRAFVCVSDIADGYTDLNNTPRTRRVKTVFLAMRHAVDDMAARTECMEIMRELFRQFASRLLLEKVKLEQNCIFVDPRISFNEIDRYFFNGAAGAYFQIAVDVYTDLRVNEEEWNDGFFDVDSALPNLWLIDAGEKKVQVTAQIAEFFRAEKNIVVAEGRAMAQEIVNNTPAIIIENVKYDELNNKSTNSLRIIKLFGATIKLLPHGQKP